MIEKNIREEKEFLEEYHAEQYDRPSVAVDLLIFTIDKNELKVLLVKRKEFPFKDYYALPGVFVKMNESLEEAAKRALYEELFLKDIYLEQIYTFGDVDRDPRMRVISIAYMALVPNEKCKPSVGERVSATSWFSFKEFEQEKIAFDHSDIIKITVERIRNKAEYTPVLFALMPEVFTLSELQKVYEVVLGKLLFKANFRKKIMPFVCETGEMSTGEKNRPSKYYRYKEI